MCVLSACITAHQKRVADMGSHETTIIYMKRVSDIGSHETTVIYGCEVLLGAGN